MYERSALILDSDDHCLAKVAKSLAVLGHQPIDSDDVDELILLARERPGQVGALILPAVNACDWWPVVRKDVTQPLGIAPRSVLAVGPGLADAGAESLHGDGLR